MSRLFSGRRASVGPSNTFRRNQSTTGTNDNSRSGNANANPTPNANVNPSTPVNSGTVRSNITTASTAMLTSSVHAHSPIVPPAISGNFNSLSESEIKGLLNRVESKLPCNSGQSLAALASDPVLTKAVDALVDFSAQIGDFVLIGLAKILEKLKKTRTLPDGNVPDQVLDSQLFILKIMNRVMGRRFSFESSSAAASSSAHGANQQPHHMSSSSLHPQPLDTQAMLYVVYVLWTCLPSHIVANIAKLRWPRHVVEREPGLGGMYKGLPSTTASLPILEPTPSPEVMYAHSYTQDEALHGLYFASVAVLISKYTTRIFYYLSAYNWQTVHLLFKSRVQLIVDGAILINATQNLSANAKTAVTSSINVTTGNNNYQYGSSRTVISGSGNPTGASGSSNPKPGSSAGIPSPSSGSSSTAYSTGNFAQTQFARYNVVPTPSASSVSFASGGTGYGGGGGGGVGDFIERPDREKEKEKSSGISVGVNLLKKGRGDKEKEKERAKEREREREREHRAGLRLAVAEPNNRGGGNVEDPVMASAGTGDGGSGGQGPSSPRSYMPVSSFASGGMAANVGTAVSSGSAASLPSLSPAIPGNLNLTVQTISKLASPALAGAPAAGGGVGQGIVDMIFKFVSISMLDCGKLMDIFGDLIKSFPQLPSEAQDQAGILIRDLIVNFSEACPSDFWKIWGVAIGGSENGVVNGIGLNSNGSTVNLGTGTGKKETTAGVSNVIELSGIAERLYDLIWDMVGATRRLPNFYAPLAALLCLVPARFEVNYEAVEGKSSGKKNTFLKHIVQAIRSRPSTSASGGGTNTGGGTGGGLTTLFGLNPNNNNAPTGLSQQPSFSSAVNSNTSGGQSQPITAGGASPNPSTMSSAAAQLIMASIPEPPLHAHDLAAQAVLDIVRLGYAIPSLSWLKNGGGGKESASSRKEQALLRVACEVFGTILKEFLFYNSISRGPFWDSTDPIDVDFYVYCTVTLFRLWPESVVRDIIMVCLVPEKSYAVKYVAVKAMVLLLVEQSKYPYQPPLDFIWPIVVSRIRSLFISCISATPEVIEGTARTVAPTPVCKTAWRAKLYAQALGISAYSASMDPNLRTPASGSANPAMSSFSSIYTSTSGTGIPLPGVIKEELRLFVIILTMMPIELKSWLHEVIPDDHVYLMRRAAGSLEPHRDKRDAAVAVMCLRSVINSCVDAGVDVKEGLDFLTYSVPGAFVNASVILTTCTEEIELVRTCIACIQTMLSRMVAFGSDERENVWRLTPLLKSVMDFAEFTLYVSLPSGQQDLSCYAQQSLRLLSVYEHLPAVGKPPNLTDSQWAKRTTFLESFDNPRDPLNITMGRVAFQKRVRKIMQQVPFLNPAHIMAFKELWFRFSKLSSRFSEASFTSFSSQQDKDDLNEWQHIMYLLATCIWKDMEDNVPPYPAVLMPMLPPRLTSGARMSDMTGKFIAECVKLLASDHVQVREYAKEALSTELNFNLFPLLFEQLDKEISARLGGGSGLEGIIPSSSSTMIFIDQCLHIFRVNFERLNASVTVFDNSTPSSLLQIGRFLARLGPSASTIHLNGSTASSGTISSSSSFGGDTMYLRLRLKFCIAVACLLGKRQFFAIREEMAFRSQLCDILINWLDEQVEAPSSPPGENKLSNDTFAAVLKLFTTALENLHLQANNFPTHVLPVNVKTDPDQIIAQKARHYISSMTKSLKYQEAPAGSVINLSLDSLSSQDDAPIIHEMVVAGISHLLLNNPKATKLSCLAGCYDSGVLLRVVYMKAFTRVLTLGTNLDVTQSGWIGGGKSEESSSAGKGDEICKLLRNSDLVTFAVVEACPTTEGENIIPILIKLYDTPERLLTFLKVTINREITRTESPASLLRLNTHCSRIITSFARHHGYTYLRNAIRYLIDSMLNQSDRPEDSSFEIEPSRLRPNEDLNMNITLVLEIVNRFLGYLIETVDSLPKAIRQVCHHIAETVSTTWLESKYPALGAFVFLRFICPAIVAPETVNITGYEYNSHLRRGLVTVAKILQSMSNQIVYGREPHNEPINFFILEHTQSVLEFLTLIQDFDTEAVAEESGNLYTGLSETDVLVLHRFLQTHADQIGQQLLDSRDSTLSGQVSQSKGGSAGGNMTMTAKQAWDTLCALLVDTKSRLEIPKLSNLDEAQHIPFQNFMRRNHRRNTDAIGEAFRFENLVDGSTIFVLTWTKIDADVVDFELLVYHIFKKLTEPLITKSKIDIILDFTGFTSRSQLPTAWLKLLLELLPLSIRQRWRRMYILNINTEALAFIRKVTSLFHGMDVVQEIILTPTFSELKSWFENVPDLMENSLPAILESNEVIAFQNVHYHIEQQLWTSANVYIGTDYIRIASVTPEKLYSDYVAYLVEVIHLRDIDDIFRGASQQRIALRQYHRRPIMMFEMVNRDPLLKALKKAKRTYASNNRTPLLPSAQTSDTCATLLAIGLHHASDKTEFVRGAAYKLLDANCAYLGYPFDALIPWRSSFSPINPLAFIVPFSDRMANFSPTMTLDFILEWSGGLANATVTQKNISLQYITPWIRNLDMFVDSAHPFYDVQGLRKCLRVFVDITMQDQDVYATFQTVWSQLAQLSESVVVILLEELTQVALNDGMDSLRCELVADTLVAFSSYFTRTWVLNQLREMLNTVLDKPHAKIAEAAEWKSISVLSRLSLAIGHGMDSHDANLQSAGEIAYLITMLAGVGGLTMRISVHGMALNLLQTLYALHAENESIGMQLRGITDELNSTEVLKMFGLYRPFPSADLVLTSIQDTQVPTDDLEKIVKILMKALSTGATSVGMQNVCKAGWLGELSKAALQPSPHAQYRAFVVLGALAEMETKDQPLYQWLEILRRNILTDNVESSLAILRCIGSVVRTFGVRPNVPASLFWLGIAVLHTAIVPLRMEALRLIKACVETLDKCNVFRDFETSSDKNPVEAVLVEAREILREAAVELEALSEISFEKVFGWALVALLWRNVRTKNDSNVTKDVMMSMLRIAMRYSPGATNEERKSLDSLTMPLLLGMAQCYDRRSYERFLEQECYIVNPFRTITDGTRDVRGDDDYHLSPDLLGIRENQDAMLAFTFFLVIENNSVNGPGAIEHLHFLWAELAKAFPNECTWAVWHFKETAPPEWMQKKYESAFSVGMSDAHTRAVATCFDLMISRVANITPEGTPNASATSLPQSLSEQDSPGSIFLAKMGMLGLHGLWKPLLRYANIEPPVPAEKTRKLKSIAADLIDLIRP